MCPLLNSHDNKNLEATGKGTGGAITELKGRESQEGREACLPLGNPPTLHDPHLVVGQVQVTETRQMLKCFLWEPFKGQVRALDEGWTAGEQASHPLLGSSRPSPPVCVYPVFSEKQAARCLLGTE